MWRYLVGALAALLLAFGGILWWRTSAVAERTAAEPVRMAQAAEARDLEEPIPEPPVASEKTREQRRLGRYDKDKDGRVSHDEYMASRRKAFSRLDLNGDGRLSFDEWAAKTESKFVGADGNRDRTLTAAEFAATRVPRKAAPRVKCPPPQREGIEEG